jgi:hypothetical protein
MTDPHRPEPAPETPESIGPDPAVTPLQAPVGADAELFIGPLPLPEPPPMTLPAKAVCVWCGRKVKYTSDEQAREHFAYCGPDCKAEMDNVFSDDMERAFNKSQRLKKPAASTAPPWIKNKPKKAGSGSQKLEAVGA